MDPENKQNLQAAEQQPQSYPASPIQNAPAAPPAEFSMFEPGSEKKFFQRNPLFSVAMIFFGLDVLCLIGAYLTTIYDVAANLTTIGFFLGLIGTAVLGASVIQGSIRTAHRRRSEGRERPQSTTVILAILSFVGAGFVGLFVTVVIAGLTSDRACQLSSSKCM
jgi:hypothetical protein